MCPVCVPAPPGVFECSRVVRYTCLSNKQQPTHVLLLGVATNTHMYRVQVCGIVSGQYLYKLCCRPGCRVCRVTSNGSNVHTSRQGSYSRSKGL